MLSVVFILYLVGKACSYNLSCSDQSENSVTFQPSDNLGRYTADICTRIQPNVTIWSIDLLYNDKATACNRTHHSRRPGKLHSELTLRSLDHELRNLNCSFVCLSVYFEMIFSSCYMIKSTFFQVENEFPPYDTYHNITNKFNISHFEDDPSVSIVYHEKYISIHFYTVAPLTDYFVQLCPQNSTSTDNVCTTVNEQCVRAENDTTVVCSLPLSRGRYSIKLHHVAPWTTGVFANRSIVTYEFDMQEARAREVNGSDWRVVWVCGALLLLAGAVVLLWRHRDAIKLHKRVLRYWTERSEEGRGSVGAGGEGGEGEEGAECRHVLLVYAREGAAGQRVAEALRAAVQAGTRAAVHDVFSAETVAAAAAGGAPAEWLRALAARADCRLLVLQTPALARVRPPPASPCTPAAAPLLYRVPQFGDSLAQFALRLLQHSSAHRPEDQGDLPAYKKYYLATVSELETEVFPAVVPFRRYALPEAAPLLLRELAGPAALQRAPELEEALQRLRVAAREFAAQARADPDYLREELVFA